MIIDNWFIGKEYKKLHLGCGSKYFDGWCNIDLHPQVDGEMHRGTEVRIDIEADLSNLPASDNIADLAFCSHVFEHFSFDEAINTLEEIFRVLKPGGIVVIEMPERTAV
ncbi:methyltransferase domain-containing protein [Rhodobacterales bacterium FZCC0188]|nr:methyltransferase domain-containing protein [Rhodobacterales bacterium FZCC0188]